MQESPYMPAAKSVEWSTPQPLFDRLHREFGFTLDVCATAQNTKCDRFFTPEDDGLKQLWQGVCWCNPPYGAALKDWIRKAFLSAAEGATTVCLIPSRTDTSWWHQYVEKRAEVRFLKGRLKYGGAPWMTR